MIGLAARILFSVCCLFFTGCTYLLSPSSSQHLCSGEEPFQSTRSKTFVLQRPVKIANQLCDTGDGAARLLFAGTTNGIPEVLPIGTQICFDTFILSKDYAFFFFPTRIEYAAWFYVPSLELPEEVRFEYIWGRGRYLNRAPWEDETVLPRRYVGSDGKGYRKE